MKKLTDITMAQTNENVLIIGAGPVGQMMALMLARHGIHSHLIDRRVARSQAPRAHAVNPRTLEICAAAGIDSGHIRELGASANDAGHVRFVGTLTGPEFGSMTYERQDDGAFESTPYPLTNIPQPRFEEVLDEAIAGSDSITFERGVTAVSVSQDDGGAEVVLDSNGQETTRHYDYVVAADGAGSRTRNALGIEMEGPEALQHYVMIHFHADLRGAVDGRPGLLYFLFDPSSSGVLINYDTKHDWVLMQSTDPASETVEDFDDDRCKALVEAAVGAPVDDLVIAHKSPWTMSAQVATRYRDNRVFLVGDAAHRFPPTGGLGLNTGVADAQNLAWKLAYVMSGRAGASLLDTYESERRPVAQVNTEQSLTNSAKIFELFVAIYGSDPEKTAEHYKAVVERLPAGDDEVLAAAVEAQRPHFDSFNLQLGYSYDSAAVRDGHHETSPHVSDYQPSWSPGARVPHSWIRQGEHCTSFHETLDMTRFSLITRQETGVTSEELNVVDLSRVPESALSGLPAGRSALVRPDGHVGALLADEELGSVADVRATLLGLSAGG